MPDTIRTTAELQAILADNESGNIDAQDLRDLAVSSARTSHQHAGTDITSGIVPAARLGTGTASASTILYGNGTWGAAPSGGGGSGTITSVNGDVGPAVTLDAADVGAYTTAQVDTALTAKANASTVTSHLSNTSNPHSVTAAQVGAVPTTRTISTSAPLAGGGALSADLTLTIGAASGSAAGSMSSAHYTLLNGATSAATNSAVVQRDSTGGATFGGTLTAAGIAASKRVTSGVVAVGNTTGTYTTDASQGNQFNLTLTGNLTLANPTNAVDGQGIAWRIKQDGTGSRTITLGSNFRLGTDVTAVVLSTAASKTDYLAAVYNAADTKWDVIAFTKGF